MYYFCLRKGLATSLFRVVTFKTANKMKCLSLMPLLAAGIGIVSCNSQSEISYEIVPTPKTMTAGRGSFLINDNTLISLPDSCRIILPRKRESDWPLLSSRFLRMRSALTLTKNFRRKAMS